MKLVLMGYSGTGKTTLAAKLGQLYGCKVLHLDQIQFSDTFEMQEPQKALSMADEILAGQENWIIDGYLGIYIREDWLRQADKIVFLNLGRLACLYRLLKRHGAHYAAPRSPAPSAASPQEAGAKERPEKRPLWHRFTMWTQKRSWKLLQFILIKEGRLRKNRYYYRAGERYPEKFVVLHSQRQIDWFTGEIQRAFPPYPSPSPESCCPTERNMH